MILRNAGASAPAVRAHISGPAGMAGLIIAIRRAVLATAACLAAAACGTSQATSVALPARDAAPAPAPAVSPSAVAATPQQAVAAGYAGYWQAYAQAMTAGNAASAGRILAPYAAASTIPRLIASLQDVWAAHDEAYGGAQPHVLGITVTGARALPA